MCNRFSYRNNHIDWITIGEIEGRMTINKLISTLVVINSHRARTALHRVGTYLSFHRKNYIASNYTHINISFRPARARRSRGGYVQLFRYITEYTRFLRKLTQFLVLSFIYEIISNKIITILSNILLILVLPLRAVLKSARRDSE